MGHPPGAWSVIGEFLALFSAFAFAFGSVAIAKATMVGSGQVGVLLSVLLTGLLALICWLVIGQPLGSVGQITWSAVGWFAVSGVLATVWGRLTLFKAIQNAGIIRASTIRRLTPFFSVFFAWLLLGEQVGWMAGGGIALIGASFVLLIMDGRRKLVEESGGVSAPPNIPRGYMFGILCALFYALSYIARKYGLIELPDAFLGALLSSLAALAYYLVGGTFSTKFRSIIAQSLRRPERWQFIAALCISVGQVSQFIALKYTGVSQLALINSVEIYISAYLAVMVFRMERMPSVAVLVAAALATLGVVLTTIG